MTGSEDPQGRPDISGHSHSSPRAPGVDQHPRANHARVREPTGSTSCPARFGPVSKGPWGRPELPGDSGQGPRARGPPVSWATPDCTRGLAELTSSSEGLGSVFESLQCRSAVSRNSRLRPRARGVDQLSLQFGAGSESPQGRPAVSHDSGPGPRSRGVDQLSQVTPAQVLGPTVDLMSQAPRARARCPARLTSCPGGLGPGSECPRFDHLSPDSGPVPRSRGVNQVSRATRIQV